MDALLLWSSFAMMTDFSQSQNTEARSMARMTMRRRIWWLDLVANGHEDRIAAVAMVEAAKGLVVVLLRWRASQPRRGSGRRNMSTRLLEGEVVGTVPMSGDRQRRLG